MAEGATFLVDIKNSMDNLIRGKPTTPGYNKRAKKTPPHPNPHSKDPLGLQNNGQELNLYINDEDTFKDMHQEATKTPPTPAIKSQLGAVINNGIRRNNNDTDNKGGATKEEINERKMREALTAANEKLDNYFEQQQISQQAYASSESAEAMEEDIELQPFEPAKATTGRTPLLPLRKPNNPNKRDGPGGRSVPTLGPEHNRHLMITAIKIAYVQMDPLIKVAGDKTMKFYRLNPALPLPHILNKIRDDNSQFLQEVYYQYLAKLLGCKNRAHYTIKREGTLKKSTVFGTLIWDGQKSRSVAPTEARIDPDTVLVKRQFVGDWDVEPSTTISGTFHYTGEYMPLPPCPKGTSQTEVIRNQIEHLIEYQDQAADIPHCNVLKFLNGDPPVVPKVLRPKEKSDDWNYRSYPLEEGLRPQLASRLDRERHDKREERKQRDVMDYRRHH